MDADTRALMRAKAVTVWLRADLDVLYDRVRRRGHRPLLRQGDPKEILGRLMTQRYPIYAEADIVVDSTAQPADRTTEQVIEALRAHLHAQPMGTSPLTRSRRPSGPSTSILPGAATTSPSVPA